MLAVSNTNIAQAIRYVSVERGLDPSEFTLVAFGGAGPLHAAAVARELNMVVLVPPAPGVLCAMGVLTKDIQLDLSQTRLIRGLTGSAAAAVGEIFSELERRASSQFLQNGMDVSALRIERVVDARYDGQNFELPVTVTAGPVDSVKLDGIRDGFNAAHQRLYGYSQPDKEVEIVTFRVKALLPVPKPNLAPAQRAGGGEAARPKTSRRTYFESVDTFVSCPVFERAALAPGMRIKGPAIVEQMDTTTIIPPDFEARADEWGNLILQCQETPRG
jgi:N-methylhydantoinase A